MAPGNRYTVTFRSRPMQAMLIAWAGCIGKSVADQTESIVNVKLLDRKSYIRARIIEAAGVAGLSPEAYLRKQLRQEGFFDEGDFPEPGEDISLFDQLFGATQDVPRSDAPK